MKENTLEKVQKHEKQKEEVQQDKKNKNKNKLKKKNKILKFFFPLIYCGLNKYFL